MRKLIILMAALLFPLTAVPSFAAQIRVFVADINATGVQNRDEMKMTLGWVLPCLSYSGIAEYDRVAARRRGDRKAV